jgi:hypothetical protein
VSTPTEEIIAALRVLADQRILATLVGLALETPARRVGEHEDRPWDERCREALGLMRQAQRVLEGR